MHIRPAQSADRDALLDIWMRSVRATHRFLTEADVQSLLAGVRDRWLVGLEVWVLTEADRPIGFMGMSGDTIEALFLAPEHLRRGGGQMLVDHAASRHTTMLVDVNEQNPEARQFYEAMRFVVVGRSEVDGQGRPFPLLHMRRRVG